jgi:hypothetical protein
MASHNAVIYEVATRDFPKVRPGAENLGSRVGTKRAD